MLKLKDLVAMTPGEITTRARSVAIYSDVAKLSWRAPNVVFSWFRMRAKDATTHGKVKSLEIKLFGNAQNPADNECWVTCDCEYFLFNVEVALATYGSSSIIHSNGMAPKETNPNLMPHLCKHLIAASMRLKNIKVSDPDGLAEFI